MSQISLLLMLLPINFFTDFINNHLLALAGSIPQNCSLMATAFASSSPVQKTTCHWAFNFDYHLPIPPSVLTTTIAFRRRNTTVKCSGGAYDVIIVGAGVTGSALAHTLAKDGRRVHVIERDLREPDRIVGELLQPGGYLKLIELGLQDCVEQIDAQRVLGYVLFKDGESTNLPYPLQKFHADVTGKSFHNGRFIQRLREKAAALPNVQMEQGIATSLLEDDNKTIIGVHYKTKDRQEFKAYAPLTIVCDGCFSNLRHSLCHPKVEVPSCFVGLILENCQLPFQNYGHVILADPSPILFYPISSTEIRCLVDIPGHKVHPISNGEMADYLKTMVTPQIPPELHDAFVSAINRGNIRTMPNGSMPADPRPTPGALLMGDAFNMRHPLTGGGMTVALSDIVVLQDLLKPLCDLNDAASLCRYLESFYTLRKVSYFPSSRLKE
ncbi:squalene monooxygenase SE1-like isoform X2 [Lotus japonicus]|uniref:squalene monooxygenase SE1-like isoform X2 n=1 Tax=Lotus japonicus TaxID=34305 RepID=UPI00258C4981|nr:squalene monooxygenase SE1-like isoform X2 [Lotus japonicus]